MRRTRSAATSTSADSERSGVVGAAEADVAGGGLGGVRGAGGDAVAVAVAVVAQVGPAAHDPADEAVGGVGRLCGPVAGAALYVLLEHQLGQLTEYWQLPLGILLLLVVLFARGGVVGLVAGRRSHA